MKWNILYLGLNKGIVDKTFKFCITESGSTALKSYLNQTTYNIHKRSPNKSKVNSLPFLETQCPSVTDLFEQNMCSFFFKESRHGHILLMELFKVKLNLWSHVCGPQTVAVMNVKC